MTKKELEIKIIELDPHKQNLIIVGKGSGISKEELYRFPREKLGKESVFLIVDDINQIRVDELNTFQKWIDKQQEKLKESS